MKNWLISLAFAAPMCCVATEPYEWTAALTLEAVHNFTGGMEEGTAELLNADLTFALDTESAGWWRGGEWFIYALGNAGEDPSELVGDIQGISNIAAPEAVKIYEFWYRHEIADDQAQLLFGLHDYNSAFYALDSATLFTLSSFGIGPDTSQVAPSVFPTTALTLHLAVERGRQYWLAAVYDGVPGDPDNPRGTHINLRGDDGLFLAAEWGFASPGAFKFGVGCWHHSADFENPIDAETEDDNTGVYAVVEKYLGSKWAVFTQAGHARPTVNVIENYIGLGMTYSEVWRDGDSLGLALAQARNSEHYREENPGLSHAETTWELTYFLQLQAHLGLQTSVYYVHRPSMDKSLDDALALGLRLYLEI